MLALLLLVLLLLFLATGWADAVGMVGVERVAWAASYAARAARRFRMRVYCLGFTYMGMSVRAFQAASVVTWPWGKG